MIQDLAVFYKVNLKWKHWFPCREANIRSLMKNQDKNQIKVSRGQFQLNESGAQSQNQIKNLFHVLTQIITGEKQLCLLIINQWAFFLKIYQKKWKEMKSSKKITKSLRRFLFNLALSTMTFLKLNKQENSIVWLIRLFLIHLKYQTHFLIQ